MEFDTIIRRTFLSRSFSFLLFLLIWPVRKLKALTPTTSADTLSSVDRPESDTPRDQPPVAVVQCGSYEYETVYAAVTEALKAAAFQVPRGIRVLIKPNIIAQNTPDQAATTHPVVVDALCRVFKDAACTITIGDASAFYQGGGTCKGMETSGMTAVAQKYGARILPFEKTSIRRIESGKVLKPFWITTALFEHDLVVDVPKLKVHQLARYTGAIKNMYGCIPGGTKQLYHERFQNRADYKELWGGPLVDVYEVARPGLSVMDAVYGLDEDGPAATGTPRLTGVILASVNGAQLDVAACRMIGFDPRWVPAVRVALERGLADDKTIRIIGKLPNVPYVKLPDKPPSKMSDYFFHQVIMKPVVVPSRCTEECTACAALCGPGAISFDAGNKPVIDYNKCIRCYCCAEQCPGGAIRLHGGFFNHTIRFLRRIKKI